MCDLRSFIDYIAKSVISQIKKVIYTDLKFINDQIIYHFDISMISYFISFKAI